MSAAARGKLLLAKYGTIIAVVLLVAGAGALFMGYQVYADPPEETVTQEFDVEEYSVSSETRAIVDPEGSRLYEPGEELVDMPAYFYNETPDLIIVGIVQTPEDVDVDVSARMTLHQEASRDERIFWERTRLIAEENGSVSDDSFTIEATQDMRDVLRDVDEIQERVGTVGDLDTFVRLTVEYESELYEGRLVADSAIQLGSEAYWLAEDLEASTTESQTETATVQVDPPMAQVGGLVAIGLILFSIAGWILLTIARGIDEERLRTELARGEYTEWISRGEIPTAAEKQFVSIDSLEDLVDVAIDSNRRVIYDADIDTYGVVEGDLVYYYSPADEDVAEWLGI